MDGEFGSKTVFQQLTSQREKEKEELKQRGAASQGRNAFLERAKADRAARAAQAKKNKKASNKKKKNKKVQNVEEAVVTENPMNTTPASPPGTVNVVDEVSRASPTKGRPRRISASPEELAQSLEYARARRVSHMRNLGSPSSRRLSSLRGSLPVQPVPEERGEINSPISSEAKPEEVGGESLSPIVENRLPENTGQERQEGDLPSVSGSQLEQIAEEGEEEASSSAEDKQGAQDAQRAFNVSFGSPTIHHQGDNPLAESPSSEEKKAEEVQLPTHTSSRGWQLDGIQVGASSLHTIGERRCGARRRYQLVRVHKRPGGVYEIPDQQAGLQTQDGEWSFHPPPDPQAGFNRPENPWLRAFLRGSTGLPVTRSMTYAWFRLQRALTTYGLPTLPLGGWPVPLIAGGVIEGMNFAQPYLPNRWALRLGDKNQQLGYFLGEGSRKMAGSIAFTLSMCIYLAAEWFEEERAYLAGPVAFGALAGLVLALYFTSSGVRVPLVVSVNNRVVKQGGEGRDRRRGRYAEGGAPKYVLSPAGVIALRGGAGNNILLKGRGYLRPCRRKPQLKLGQGDSLLTPKQIMPRLVRAAVTANALNYFFGAELGGYLALTSGLVLISGLHYFASSRSNARWLWIPRFFEHALDTLKNFVYNYVVLDGLFSALVGSSLLTEVAPQKFDYTSLGWGVIGLSALLALAENGGKACFQRLTGMNPLSPHFSNTLRRVIYGGGVSWVYLTPEGRWDQSYFRETVLPEGRRLQYKAPPLAIRERLLAFARHRGQYLRKRGVAILTYLLGVGGFVSLGAWRAQGLGLDLSIPASNNPYAQPQFSLICPGMLSFMVDEAVRLLQNVQIEAKNVDLARAVLRLPQNVTMNLSEEWACLEDACTMREYYPPSELMNVLQRALGQVDEAGSFAIGVAVESTFGKRLGEAQCEVEAEPREYHPAELTCLEPMRTKLGRLDNLFNGPRLLTPYEDNIKIFLEWPASDIAFSASRSGYEEIEGGESEVFRSQSTFENDEQASENLSGLSVRPFKKGKIPISMWVGQSAVFNESIAVHIDPSCDLIGENNRRQLGSNDWPSDINSMNSTFFGSADGVSSRAPVDRAVGAVATSFLVSGFDILAPLVALVAFFVLWKACAGNRAKPLRSHPRSSAHARGNTQAMKTAMVERWKQKLQLSERVNEGAHQALDSV